MRDRRASVAEGYVKIDIVEIEAMWEVQQVLALMGVHQPIVITSGYRTPETNAATEGAARNSMHIYGKAADLYVPGVSMRELSTSAGRARSPAAWDTTTTTSISIPARAGGG